MSDLKDFLLATHPWYQAMIGSADEWPLMRAVTGGFSDRATKERFLPSGTYENCYSTRIDLSHFLGKTSGIAASFAGAVFVREPEIDYAPTSETPAEDPTEAAPKPKKLGTAEAALQSWADNVDGQGNSITDLLETNSDEAITMGLVGYYVTKPAITPAQQKSIDEAKASGVANKDGVLPEDQVKKLGLNKSARVRKFAVENILDWEVDDEGRLVWVKLAHEVTRQATPFQDRETLCQWIVLTREEAIVFEAPITNTGTTQLVTFPAGQPSGADAAPSDAVVSAAPPTASPGASLTFPILTSAVGDPVEVKRVPHKLNLVPFVIQYGGGERVATLQAQSLLNGAKRADLAHFNFWSWFTYALYLHNCPLLEIITSRQLDDVVRDLSRAFVLQPSNAKDGAESVNYKSTPAESFDSSMRAIESITREAFQQAGADPGSVVEDGTQESGKAKQVRHRHTEARRLTRISKDDSAAHYDLLEIGARCLMASAPDIDTPAFAGSARYAQQFDLADANELGEQFTKVGPKIKSITFQKGLLKRLALLIRGEVSKAERAKIEAEIDALTEDDIFPPPPVEMGPDGKPLQGAVDRSPEGVDDSSSASVKAAA